MWTDPGQTYSFHDKDPGKDGAFEIRFEEAQMWNQLGYGIFWPVNLFKGPRQIDCLVKVNGWPIDMDRGSKPEMIAKIRTGLIPTLVIEGKRGFHVYWKAKDGTKENWNRVFDECLLPFYNADENAKDLARLLRRPGFHHMKDPSNPFLVKTVWEFDVSYSEQEMFMFYKSKVKLVQKISQARPQLQIREGEERWRKIYGPFWEKVRKIDCVEGLKRLSGSKYVNFENYEFKEMSSGNKNIIVNGKQIRSFIDQKGFIASCIGGGPTIAQWVNWFHHDYKKTIEIIKEVFPECQD